MRDAIKEALDVTFGHEQAPIGVNLPLRQKDVHRIMPPVPANSVPQGARKQRRIEYLTEVSASLAVDDFV